MEHIRKELPKPPTLKGDENFVEWKTALRRSLMLSDRLQHIDSDVTIPTSDDGRKKVLTERVLTMMEIEATITPVRKMLLRNGWDFENESATPKQFYDKICTVVPFSHKAEAIHLVQQLVNLRLEQYTSTLKFIDNFIDLDNRLKGMEMTMETFTTLLFLRALRDPLKSMILREYEEGRLTKDKVIEQATKAAQREEHAQMPSITPSNNPRPRTSNNNKKDKKTEEERKTERRNWVTQFPGQYSTDGKHVACDKYHPGGNDRCFVLHPELKTTNNINRLANNDRASNEVMQIGSGLSATFIASEPTSTSTELAALASNCIDPDTVCYDSGSSRHTFNHLKWFESCKILEYPAHLTAANGATTTAEYGGIVKFYASGRHGKVLVRARAIYQPSAPCNLLSPGIWYQEEGLCSQQKTMTIDNDATTGILNLTWRYNVIVLADVIVPNNNPKINDVVMPNIDYAIMHNRLMHPSPKVTLKACRDAGINISTNDAASHHCEPCHLAKATNQLNKFVSLPAEQVGQILRFDLIGVNPPGHRGFNAIVHAVDQYTRYHFVKFGKKADAFRLLKEIVEEFEIHSGVHVQAIGVDGGPEFGQPTRLFVNNQLANWCRDRRTNYLPTTPYSPTQNGSAERWGRTLMEHTRAALIDAQLPEVLWPFTVDTVVRTLNLLPCRALNDISPHQALGEALGLSKAASMPYIKHLRTYGCTAYVYTKQQYRVDSQKFKPRAKKGRLIGYNSNHGTIYWIYYPDEEKVVRASAVKFYEGPNNRPEIQADEEDFVAELDDPEHDDDTETPSVWEDFPIPSSAAKPTRNDRTKPPVLKTPSLPSYDLTPLQPAIKTKQKTSQNSIVPLYPTINPLRGQRTQLLPPLPGAFSDDEVITTADDIFADAKEIQAQLEQEEPIPRPTIPPTSPTTPADDSPRRSARNTDKEVDYNALAGGKPKKKANPQLGSIVNNITISTPESNAVSLMQVQLIMANTQDYDIPKNYRAARKQADFLTKWKPAMQKQYDSLVKQGVWQLVPHTENMKVIPGKWVHDNKIDTDGNIIGRARWVVCGNFETDNWSTQDAYAAVAHSTTVKIMLAYAATMDLEIHQYDFNTAFLNAKIPDDVDVYVDQPTGFEQGKTTDICKLKKALPRCGGSKQSSQSCDDLDSHRSTRIYVCFVTNNSASFWYYMLTIS